MYATVPAATAYSAVASTYDSVYSTYHEMTENRLLSQTLRKWRFFTLPDAPPTEPIDDIPVAGTTGAPDRRYNPDTALLRQALDIGCGTGLTIELSRLAEMPLPTERYLGIDPSQGMIDVARSKFDHTFCLGDAETAHAWGSFDRVFALFGPLNYADPVKAFTALARCTKPGGLLAVVVYTPLHVAAPHYIMRDHPPPTFFYTAASLRAMLSGHGFKAIDIHGMSPPQFYEIPTTVTMKEMRSQARHYFNTTPPDDCCFLVARARR